MERRLTTILAADVVGYSRLIGNDEAGTLKRLMSVRKELVQPTITKSGGRVVKFMGDGLLAEFASVIEAVQCAADIQKAMIVREAGLEEDEKIRLRIGINLGDIIFEGSDIYGDGVNIAARLEGLAEPGGICLSGDVYRQAKGKIEAAFEDIGEQFLKNIAEPVRVYRITADRSVVSASSPTTDPLPLPSKPSIAVLPFTSMLGDSGEEYLTDGITEDIITELSRFRDLFVIARNSSFSFKGKAAKVQEIAADLGVRYLLEGSVRMADNRIRLTAQLIDAGTGHHIWAERYNREITDLFALQDEIAQTVASTVAGRIRISAQNRAVRKPTANLKAYDYVLRGQSIVGDTEENNLRARHAYEKAVELDPTSARAHVGLAISHMIDWVHRWGGSAECSINKALDYAVKAVALDRADSRAEWQLGFILTLRGEFEEAQVHLDRALDLNPNDADALCIRGILLSQTGEHDKAITSFKTAVRLNPYHPSWYLWNLGSTYYNAKRYAEALKSMKEFVGRNPKFVRARRTLAAAYAQLGRIEEAREVVKEILADQPDASLRQERERLLTQYKNPYDLEHWLEGLRRAGLPE